MKSTDLLYAMGSIDPKLIAEAAPPAVKERSVARVFRKWAAFAACLIFLCSVGFGSYAYAVGAKEYRAAIIFFDEHDLSTDGLTRGEIRRVYRDIITESFAYDKTAEVLTSHLGTEQIPGIEINQGDLLSEDLEALWTYIESHNGVQESDSDGVRYLQNWDSASNGYSIQKMEDGVLAWSVPIPEFRVSRCIATSDGVIVYGVNEITSSAQRRFSWITKLDENGNLLWQQRIDNGFHWEYIEAFLQNTDGTYTVFSIGVFEYKGAKQLCFTQYSANGERLCTTITEIGDFYKINKVIPVSDGYLLQLCCDSTNEYARVVKIDPDGNITKSFSYGSEESYYYITDMLEHNGKIYLSAYATPRSEGSRQEISGILDYLCDNDILSISSKQLTPIVRANYTALLLVCDRDLGTPEKYYSVDGSLGGRLSLSESGKLVWDVESIAMTYYSPYTGSFSIGGICYVFRYTFDTATEALISQEKTGMATSYQR